MAGTDNLRACGAKNKSNGKPCRGPALKGSSRCRMHGGGAPQVRRAAAVRIAEGKVIEGAKKYGRPRRITASDALQEELERTAGHIDWVGTEVGKHPFDPGLLSVYQSERAHLARLSHQIITTRSDERRSVLTEQSVDRLEVAMTAILSELGSDPNSDYVRGVVARHLRDALTEAVEADVVVDGDDPDLMGENLPSETVAF